MIKLTEVALVDNLVIFTEADFPFSIESRTLCNLASPSLLVCRSHTD